MAPIEAEPQASASSLVQPTPVGEMLRRAFGTEFHLLDGQTGEPIHLATEQPACDWTMLSEMCRAVSRRGRAEFVAEEPPLLVLAIPLAVAPGQDVVAVATFPTRAVGADEDLTEAAERLGMNPVAANAWAKRQSPCSPTLLERLSSVVLERLTAERRCAELEQESRQLSVHLAATYEEISLLHRLTQKLRISQRDDDLGRMALEWLEEVVPAHGLAIQFLPVARQGDTLAHQARTQTLLLTRGHCPLTSEQLSRLVEHIGLRRATQPVVLNRHATADPAWPFPEVRELIAAPLLEGDNLFGWLTALNHAAQGEFGTVEASLLGSVATIVGIHSGNLELYRQQAELLAGVVRALTSAIDAKDPYTCGHSDRVARIAVRLAQELGCPPETLDTIYLSGLLHDIGKIGINDSVLRKPDRLTDAEYEHIKTHVQIGHRILADLRKLDGILPVVLHHHESWDGHGYPEHLPGEQIPLAARIVAVADSFDAMSSDRPYRAGMPDEKIDAIFRSGAGKQWDPDVIAAFFQARDDLRRIARETGERLATPTPTTSGPAPGSPKTASPAPASRAGASRPSA